MSHSTTSWLPSYSGISLTSNDDDIGEAAGAPATVAAGQATDITGPGTDAITSVTAVTAVTAVDIDVVATVVVMLSEVMPK